MLTLRADQYHGQVGRVAVVGDLGVEVVEELEAHLVLHTEDQDDRVHPGAELELGRAALVPNQEQVAPVIHHYLLLEAPSCGEARGMWKGVDRFQYTYVFM